MFSEDENNSSYFIGAELISSSITDTALQNHEIPDLDSGDVMFVTFNTDKGDFQIVAYNIHNGYYGHYAVFIKNEEVIFHDVL